MGKFILFILFNCLSFSFPQLVSNAVGKQFERLSGARLSIGYVNHLAEDENISFKHPFINLSHRTSSFDKSSSDFKIKFAFEPRSKWITYF